MNRFIKGILIGAVSLAVISSSFITAFADSVRTVTIGADLSDAQKEKIFEFFNTNETEVNVIEINNQDERKYLEGVVADSIIGTHTYSCAYIEPTESGGVFVQTANLTWVTADMLGNALLTAGIQNCNVLATAPFEVSGTGALTGVMIAYEVAAETTLDEDKKQLASEELVLSAEISDDAENEQNDVLQALNDIKQEVIEENNLDEQKINDIVINVTNEYNLSLTDEQLEKLKEFAGKFNELDYDEADFSEALQNFKDRLTSTASEIANSDEAKSWFSKIWEAIVNFFKNLFSTGSEKISEKAGELSDEAKSFFGEINTDIIPFDNQEEQNEASSDDEVQNEDSSDDDVQNEDASDDEVQNEDASNDEVQNEDASNDDVQNEDASNDDVQNEDASNDEVAE